MARKSPKQAQEARGPRNLREQRRLFEIKQRRAEEKRHVEEFADTIAKGILKKRVREETRKQTRIDRKIRDV